MPSRSPVQTASGMARPMRAGLGAAGAVPAFGDAAPAPGADGFTGAAGRVGSGIWAAAAATRSSNPARTPSSRTVMRDISGSGR
jgi:hypothetical protein